MDFNIKLTDEEEMMNNLEQENKGDFEIGQIFSETNIYNIRPDEDNEKLEKEE